MPFYHNMLVLAREARGLTQTELSALSSIAQGTLSKYETGLLEIPEIAAWQLSRVLDFPVSFFEQDERPYGFPPYHYRKRKKLSAKTLGRVIAEMNIRRMHIKALRLSFPNRSNGFIPEIDPDDYHGRSNKRLNIEDIARNLREMWMLPSGPIPSIMQLLEENGAIVIPCEFGTDLLDAMSQRIDGMPVLIFVNTNTPADRLRLTLAHELAHMVLHTTTLHDDDKMEDEADEFAGAFLMPADEIRSQLRRFDLRQLANMKLYWRVSMAAIAVRADRLQIITPYQKKMFWMEMSRLGYRKREPNEPPREEPRLLKQMVGFHRKRLGYSDTELAKVLHLTDSEFQKMYPADPPTDNAPRTYLRLVK